MFCVDYRRLNAVTEKDVYPIRRMDDIVGRFGGMNFFSTLDLQSGFWQLAVAAHHREKTTFTSPDGLFYFNCLSFKLCSAPPTFQRLLDQVLAGLKWNDCLVYMDDILVKGRTLQEHKERLDRVLQAVGDVDLILNLKKCHFTSPDAMYLGHQISLQGIKLEPAQIQAAKDFPPPVSTTKLRAFLGLAFFIENSLKDFHKLQRVLHVLLKKGAEVERDWGIEQTSD